MSEYIAKKVSLPRMRECSGCGCFTCRGCYIQYRSNTTDTMLFICDECFEEKYKNLCIPGEFDEDQYLHNTGTNRYQSASSASPIRRSLTGFLQGATKALRPAFITTAVSLAAAILLQEQPEIRTDYLINAEINDNLHFDIKNPEPLKKISASISNQLRKIFTHEEAEDGQ